MVSVPAADPLAAAPAKADAAPATASTSAAKVGRIRMVTAADPFAYFRRHPDGTLRAGLYRRIPARLISDALKLGWVSVPPRWCGPYELETILCEWIPCECGRQMPLPLWEEGENICAS